MSEPRTTCARAPSFTAGLVSSILKAITVGLRVSTHPRFNVKQLQYVEEDLAIKGRVPDLEMHM